jgi:methylmalonyl-CoA/ethylmalonyl-CoA epimerase
VSSVEPIFTGINHVSIVTRDLDAAIRRYADGYGIKPWSVYTYDDSNMSVQLAGRETPFRMRVGLCHVGPTTRFELIQPLDELSPYAQALSEHGGAEHVHHIRLDVADYDDAVGHLRARGLPTILEGRFAGGIPGVHSDACYFGTEGDLGFIVEVARRPPDFPMQEPDYVYPPA